MVANLLDLRAGAPPEFFDLWLFSLCVDLIGSKDFNGDLVDPSPSTDMSRLLKETLPRAASLSFAAMSELEPRLPPAIEAVKGCNDGNIGSFPVDEMFFFCEDGARMLLLLDSF